MEIDFQAVIGFDEAVVPRRKETDNPAVPGEFLVGLNLLLDDMRVLLQAAVQDVEGLHQQGVNEPAG